MDKRRNSNVELLRIVMMIFIIFYHNAIHGGYSFEIITSNKILVDVLSMFGKIAVNIFIVITGYYSIDKNFNINKVVHIWIEVLFYSIVLGIVSIAFLVYTKEITTIAEVIKEVIKFIFPIVFGNYWFASAFIILCFISPFINRFIHSLSYAEFRICMIVLIVVWSVIPTITLGKSDFGFNNYLWAPITYMIGAYIKLYPPKWNKEMVFLGTGISVVIQMLNPIACNLLGGAATLPILEFLIL